MHDAIRFPAGLYSDDLSPIGKTASPHVTRLIAKQPDTTITTRLSLRILATTDLHGHLRGTPRHCTGGKTKTRTAGSVLPDYGLTQIATLISQARSEVQNCLLVDSGDILQGSLIADYWATQNTSGSNGIHPMIFAMNALRYDAACPGNHDFDFGPEFLFRAVAQAQFPWVCANAQFSFPVSTAPNAPPIAPWTILKRSFHDDRGRVHELRIGVIGFTPQQTGQRGRTARGPSMRTEDILTNARQTVPQLRAEGADLIIALAHTGVPETMAERIEHVAPDLAALSGIDVIICGHSHKIFPNTVPNADPAIDAVHGRLHGKPAVLPGHWGSHLGLIDLVLDYDGAKWSLGDTKTSLRPVAQPSVSRSPHRVAELPEILTFSTSVESRLNAELNRAVGQTRRSLNSFFSLITPTTAMAMIAAAKTDYVRHATGDRDAADFPVVTVVSPGRFGGFGGPDNFLNIRPGPLTFRDVLTICDYPNSTATIRLTGAEIRRWLNWSNSIYRRIRPHEPHQQQLLDPQIPAYYTDAFFGLTYQIDLSEPARFSAHKEDLNVTSQRIQSLCYRGQPVADTDTFLVITNNYRASCFGASYADRIQYFPMTTRGVLHRWLLNHPNVNLRPPEVWRFKSVPGASVWFDTSPDARAHISQLKRYYDIEKEQIMPDGFLRIRLNLGGPIQLPPIPPSQK